MQSLPSGCLSDNQINHWISGGVGTAELSRIESHIAECAACRRVVVVRATSSVPQASTLPEAGAFRDDADDVLRAPVGEDCGGWDAGRYEIRGEIARGGMGRILEAWDRRHERSVAIKVLLPGAVAIGDRFAREVHLTARLEHPSIVAFYDAGRSPAGEPFFVMKLVRGRSLATALTSLPALSGRLALLPHLIAATEALAYAHEQRIIHRDLKPANVLLGTFGETVVIDWGLAKELGAAEARAGEEVVGPIGGQPPPELTVAGHALGTPCYMPPEQARGEQVDERADVYALGALLYHVLAGEPPFVGGTSRDVIGKVLAGPPAPLTARSPAIPPDLAAIVEKAMARRPAARYESAREMAADLRRFVSGQLVAAHAYTLGALLRRWIARRRGVLATAAVLLAVLAVTTSVSIRRTVRERDRADALRVLADNERSLALTQRDAAERLVGFMVGRLRERLEALGKLDLLAGVGTEIGDYYRALGPAESGNDPAPLRRRGLALLTLADVDAKKRSYETATALARAAVDVFAAACRRDARDLDSAALLVAARGALAGILLQSGHADLALAEGKVGSDAATALVAAYPADVHARIAAAFAESRYGLARVNQADIEGGRRSAALALAAIEHPPDAATIDSFWQDTLGQTYRSLAGVAMAAQDWAGVVKVARAGVDHRRQQLAAQPDHVEDLNALAYLLRSEAFAEDKLGHAAAALERLREALAIWTRILELEPQDATARYDQGTALAIACDHERAWLGPAAAEADCAAALRTMERVMKDRAGDSKVEDAMGRALRATGRMYLAAHRGQEAASTFQQAIEVAERAAARDPGSFVLAINVTQGLSGRANAELSLGRPDAARTTIEEAIAGDEKQRAAHPTVGFFDEDLGDRFGTLGDVEVARGDVPAAKRAFGEAIAHLERAVAADPEDTEAAVTLAGVYVHAAAAAGNRTERAKLDERARALFQPLEEAGRLTPEQVAQMHPAMHPARR